MLSILSQLLRRQGDGKVLVAAGDFQFFPSCFLPCSGGQAECERSAHV